MKKMTTADKVKLIFLLEYIIIAILVIVIATLRLTGVMAYSSSRVDIFNWITIFGGSWVIADGIWTIASKARRKKNSLLDKVMLLPLGIYLVTFDIMCFAGMKSDVNFTKFGIIIALYTVGAIYLFQGIYHFYKPGPQILEAIKEAELEKQKKEAKDSGEIVTEEKPTEEAPKEEEKE